MLSQISKSFMIFVKHFISDVWKVSKYASDDKPLIFHFIDNSKNNNKAVLVLC